MTDLSTFLLPLFASALGGAFVAGGFGVYNNQTAKADEREKWIRDSKIEGYSAYLDATESMAFAVSVSWNGPMTTSEVAAKFAEYAPGKLEIMAPKGLRAAAHELELELYEYLDAARRLNPSVGADHDAFQAALDVVNEKRHEVIRLMQQDLDVAPIEYPVSGRELIFQ